MITVERHESTDPDTTNVLGIYYRQGEDEERAVFLDLGDWDEFGSEDRRQWLTESVQRLYALVHFEDSLPWVESALKQIE